jgi:hypothetical protein
VVEGLDEVLAVPQGLLPGEINLPAPELLLSSLGAASVATGAVHAALEAARSDVLRLGRPVIGR